MHLLQQTITSVVKHLTYIITYYFTYIMSFKTGAFPSRMKLTEVILGYLIYNGYIDLRKVFDTVDHVILF